MTWLVLAGAVLLVVLVAFGAWGYQTANRLNRLNVRYDLSWQSLDSALARRAVVARAVAIDAYGGAGRTLTAVLPTYFEIVERPHALVHGDQGASGRRTSARVVLLDDSGAVLLLCGSDPANPAFRDGAAPKWWFTVGGQVRPGERLAQAAARELAEETGLRVAPADMIGPIWRRDEVFEFNGSLIDSEEFYLVHRTRRFEPAVQGRTELERRYIRDARWCDANDIAQLVAAGERVYPLQLGELLPAANRLVDVALDNGAARDAGVPQPIR